jgi:hypothetical protein
MRSHSLRLLSVAVVSCFAVVAVPAHAGNTASAGVVVGFARVNLGDGTVSAFGGKGTRAVSTGPTLGGVIVFLDGKYWKDLTRDQVVVQATAEAGSGSEFAVANAIVASATRDSISVTVNAWQWTAGGPAPVDGWVFLTVYSGLVPPLPK